MERFRRWSPRLAACAAPASRFRLLFHDTHHRAVSEPDAMRRYDLSAYDGVLAFGEALAGVYRTWGWVGRVFVWHEAADIAPVPTSGDRRGTRNGAVWIGNWGDGERTAELESFLFGAHGSARPAARRLWRKRYPVCGARHARAARRALPRLAAQPASVPAVFARHKMTVHVPRRFYADSPCPAFPTIRVFEALACGIPLVSAPWQRQRGACSRRARTSWWRAVVHEGAAAPWPRSTPIRR